jgi:hypothetical protein
MFHIGGAAVVAATFFMAVSGSAMLAAAADPADTVVAQATESPAQERTRQDCIRNGGWYVEGGCEYETKAKAAAMESDKQACQRDGGYWDTAAGACEIESKGIESKGKAKK